MPPANEGPLWEIEVAWRSRSGDADAVETSVPVGEGRVPQAEVGDPRSRELRGQVREWLAERGQGELGAHLNVALCDLYYLAPADVGAVEARQLSAGDADRIAQAILHDSVTQTYEVRRLDAEGTKESACGPKGRSLREHVAVVRKKSGVMEPVAESLLSALEDLGFDGLKVRLARRVRFCQGASQEGARGLLASSTPESWIDAESRKLLGERLLSNPAIEDVYWDEELLPPPFARAHPYRLDLRRVALAGLDDDELLEVSRRGQLSLDLAEMRAIRDHYAALGRDPSDVELETIAQTWSEHCCHKTLTSRVEHRRGEEPVVVFENLLKDTIARATREIMQRDPSGFCLSVFRDNAGVIAFDDEYGISFKVETHNHPSAIEPYGGAGTGIGGVLRDTLGTGLGAKPIVNTDVFCFGPPDLPQARVPAGALHPLRVLRGVVAGVRDYGNRMGIPTANGAVYFDERYIGNPLVFCGSVGLIPRSAVEKSVAPGDRVVVAGGRTGRDGIHGATFSSIELSEESESVSSGAVQIGNAITEKKLLDLLLDARDRGLYRGVTDCGAGGLSSAVGEMAEETGARVDLERTPLKYEGLSHWEIWISEAQERMVFAVPPENLPALAALAREHEVEIADLGEFTGRGRLELFYEGEPVCDLDVGFLHHGRPAQTRRSRHVPHPRAQPAAQAEIKLAARVGASEGWGAMLRRLLAAPNIASKEWIIRQYDHEVQAGCVIKPLVGPGADAPGDAAVFLPRRGSLRGIAIGCGMNPCYGDLDPYRMALVAVDEALRNVVAVGGDPKRTAILDNYCWGRTDREETLGSLVEASRGAHDAAVRFGTPFISGKDSLNNEFRTATGTLSIPPSFLVSSIAIVEDVRRCVTMDLKRAGNRLVLVGETRSELGGSHFARVAVAARGERLSDLGGVVPDLPPQAAEIHAAVATLIREGLAESVHDLSEGGLAVAAAEMAFGGRVGAEISLAQVPASEPLDTIDALFSESASRYLIEVRPEHLESLLSSLGELPAAAIGSTISYGILRVLDRDGETVLAESIEDLRESWRSPLCFDAE